MKITLMIMALGLLSVNLFAETKMCDESMVRRSCDVLKAAPAQAYLALSDGFRWKNPFYSPPPVHVGNVETFGVKRVTTVDDEISRQAHILGILTQVEKKIKLSNKFKMAFASQAYKTLNGGNVSLPIPRDDENARVRTLSANEVKKLLEDFPTREREELESIAMKESPALESSVPASLLGIRTDELVNENKARMERVFGEAKASLIRSISKGRDVAKLSEFEKNLIGRLETIKLRHGDDPKVNTNAHCKNNSRNGFYSLDHTINICPMYYAASQAELVSLMGHELGHSIDPCRATLNVYKSKEEYLVADELPLLTGAIHIRGMDRKDHPLYTVDECLVKKMGIREITADDIELAANVEARYDQLALGFDNKTLKARRRSIAKEMQEKAVCEGTGLMRSQINESMSDVFGSIALEAYLQKNPPQTDIDKAVIFGSPCLYHEDLDYALDQHFEDKRSASSHGHPSSMERATKIIIQTPSLAKAFNCRRNPQYMCFDSYLNASANTSAPTNPNSPASGGAR